MSTSLFEKPAEQVKEPPPLPDFWVLLLQSKQLVPLGWRVVQWSTSDGDAPKGFVRVRGAVVPPGKLQWRKRDKATEATHFIGKAEVNSFRDELAKAQGVCRECWGNGVVYCGWSVDGGTKYKACPKCGTKT